VAIFVLVLWLATVGIGIALLRAGGAARVDAARVDAARVVVTATEARASVQLAGVPARIGALPMTAEGKPPPVPHTRVVTPAGEHPLLEFTHPALAIVGLAFWAMFTFVHYRPMAWIALAVLLVTIGMGLAWLARSGRAQQTQAPGRRFPPRLAGLHGLSAGLTILLALLSALVASR
jgi:hypothetical protein